MGFCCCGAGGDTWTSGESECTCCTGDITPTQISVDITTTGSGCSWGGSCDTLNGTYICDFVASPTSGTGNFFCGYYEKVFSPSGTCKKAVLQVYIYCPFYYTDKLIDVKLFLTTDTPSVYSYIWWYLDVEGETIWDCDFDNLAIPYAGPGVVSGCTSYTTADATITAV